MKTPLVSIITPFYNAEKYLACTIQSVIDQTYNNWELLLIDDGSTDGSYAVATTFNDSRIRIIKQENGGQCEATNSALKLVDGEFIQLLDADDLMHPQKTANQIKKMVNNEDYLGVSKWCYFYETPKDAIIKDEPVFFSGSVVDWLYQLWANDTMMHTNSYIMHRSLLNKLDSYFDESLLFNVDFDFFTRLALVSKGIIYTEDAIGYYRKGVKGSKTFNASFAKQRSALAARVKAIRYLLKKNDSSKAKEAAKMALTLLTYSYPALLPYSKQAIQDLGLDGFGKFGGSKFKAISSVFGYENAIRIKKFMGI
jgi:glycosyltransferase involved in cell wall biosynthesis